MYVHVCICMYIKEIIKLKKKDNEIENLSNTKSKK